MCRTCILRSLIVSAAAIICLSAKRPLAAEEPFQIEVNILSAPIVAGEQIIAHVPREAKLTAHQFDGSRYLVDLAGSNPPRQGWIAKDDCHRVPDDLAEVKRRLAALPAGQRAQAVEDFKREANRLDTLEKRYADFMARHQVREALPVARELAEGTARLFGEKTIPAADQFTSVGNRLGEMGDYPAARKYYEQALAIRREALGEKHPDTARSLNNLGNVADDMGDYPAARKYHEQALAIQREVLGEKHPDTAASLNNLGVVADDMGDYPAARKYHEQALAIHREFLGEKHPSTAGSLHNLGNVALDMGDYPAARKYHEQALAIRREVLGEKHPDTAASLMCLGIVAEDMGDYPAARKYYEQALAIKREVLGEKHPSTAESLNNLGNVARDMGDYPAARKYHEQALAVRREVLGEKHPSTAASLNNLGVVAEDMGDYPAARKYYEQALAIRREVLGENHPDTAMSQINLAITDAADGQWPAANADMQDARRIARRHIAGVLPALSAKEQLTFLDNTDRMAFQESLSLGFARRDDGATAMASAAWLINGKALAEEALSEQIRLEREATEPAAREALDKLKAVRGQLAAMSLKPPPAKQRDAWRQQIADLEAQEQELARTLARFGAKVEVGDPWVSLDELRKKLPADGLLVDVARFDLANFRAKGKENRWFPARYAAWLIPPAGKGEIQIVDLGEAAGIDSLVAALRKEIHAAPTKIQDEGEEKAAKELQATGRALAAAMLDPVLAKAGDAKRLILSPDGALWLVPFAALPLADGKFAIEKYQIDYVVSGRDLLRQTSAKERKQLAPLVFANPDFDLAPQEQIAQTRALLPSLQDKSDRPPADFVAQRSVALSESLGRVRRLPGTANEAEAIAPSLKSYAHAEPKMFLDKQALEGLFKAARSPKVVVLSTHGFFLRDQEPKREDREFAFGESRGAALATDGKLMENPLLRCGLLLAGCNRRAEATSDDDGVLTGMEICGTDLRGTDLVVLSACETGLGDVHVGQGVAGLRQAFQLAGAKSVVSTLWSIPDRETVQLMTDFFSRLSAGDSNGAALRSAQLAIIKSRRAENGIAHPFYWAAFTVTGE